MLLFAAIFSLAIRLTDLLARSRSFAGIFLFDKAGKPVGRFGAKDLPEIEAAIEAAVAAEA